MIPEVSARYFAAAKANWHTSATSQYSSPHLVAAKRIAKWKTEISHQSPNSAGYFAIAKVVLAHECHFAAQESHFATAKRIAKLLRNWHFAAKLAFCCETQTDLSLPCSSSSVSHAVHPPVIFSDQQRRPQFGSPKWHEHEGLNLHLLRIARRVCERSKFQIFLQTFAAGQFLSVKPAPPKPPARAIPYQVRGRPLQKRTRVESSEPIDLTEQRFANSITGPTPVPSPSSSAESPTSSISGAISGAANKISGASSATSRAPNSSKIALEEVIRRPMLPQPPIEGTWIVEARPFHSELCFDLPGIPVPAAEEVSHGALADSKRLFLSRVATDFYQSMTTNQPFSILKRRFTKISFKELIAFPSSFQGCYGQILEHLGYPSEPQLERKRICHEPFTLDKWNNMTAYKVDQPDQPQPAARRASLKHIPEGIIVAAPAIPRAPPEASASSQPSTSAERGWPFLYLNIEIVSCIEDSYSFSEQSCSGDGSHQSMPRANVGHSGSTSCHLKAAPSPFRSATSCRASTDTNPEATLSSLESHPPEPKPPADAPTEEADPSA
ncbi:hypothetical protein CK203_016033 [Vitis vinifera]|uniref:Uncharacterized protein n=1 Tax=Vitis vinifera TaxID=29760 RepID=A0A438JRP9_VITVI|nr:hypothetical protein CK203_016033 [Vitis vinifera]